MKSIARSYFWWPKLDSEIEDMAKSCTSCQGVKQAPARAPLHPWIWPTTPWQRIHVDFAGPFLGKTFFIVIDAHSKWPEVIEMSSTTSTQTIEALRKLFASYGFPEQLVSDNGPQFTSEEFKSFMKANGIKHIRCSPYHPSSNGAAERFVQTFKQAMKTTQTSSLTISHRLANFLFSYRSTPHASTNVPPSLLFLNRQFRTRFDLLRPDHQRQVCAKQAAQIVHHDLHAKGRQFSIGQKVMVKSVPSESQWVPGTVLRQLGPVTYEVEVKDGLVWKRHIDHIRELKELLSRVTSPPTNPDQDTDDFVYVPSPPENEQSDTNASSSNHRESDTGSAEPSRTHHYNLRANRRQPERFSETFTA